MPRDHYQDDLPLHKPCLTVEGVETLHLSSVEAQSPSAFHCNMRHVPLFPQSLTADAEPVFQPSSEVVTAVSYLR
jgi:hypothetical protein